MNTTSLLLGMMAMMLFVAFIFSFGGVQLGGNDNSEREELRKEIAALKQESETLRLQVALRRQPAVVAPTPYQAAPVVPVTPPAVTPPATQPIDDDVAEQLKEIQRQLAEQQVANEEMETAKAKAERKASVAEREASMAWTERTRAQQKQERERKRVEIALKMGTVASVNREYGFLIFAPANNQQFQSGQTLGIRRNSGILGQITISNEEGGNYIANIKPNAYAGGIPEAQEGDEIIVLPASYQAPGEDEISGSGGNSGTGDLRDLLPPE